VHHETVNAAPTTARLAHHGITVRDLDRELAFFVGVLGFTASPRIDLDEEFSSGVTGIAGARISVRFLEIPGLHVELLQYDGPADRPTSVHRPSDPGAAHLALYVDDVRSVVAAAAETGWHLAGAVQPITVGPRAGGRAAYLTNRDGAVVEVVQRPTT
jgi:catechol 2,3-dioxygenase-like lactoylglutathione lyase family enzyme